MIPYEYVARAGDGQVDKVLTDWALQKRQRRQLVAKLVIIASVDREQAVGSILYKMALPEIYYVKINGEVALRPRCCLGPTDSERVTFLERVSKKGNREDPPSSSSKATVRLGELVESPTCCAEVTFHREDS